jgi:hypothetical protein
MFGPKEIVLDVIKSENHNRGDSPVQLSEDEMDIFFAYEQKSKKKGWPTQDSQNAFKAAMADADVLEQTVTLAHGGAQEKAVFKKKGKGYTFLRMA